jgi:hypothetical protein
LGIEPASLIPHNINWFLQKNRNDEKVAQMHQAYYNKRRSKNLVRIHRLLQRPPDKPVYVKTQKLTVEIITYMDRFSSTSPKPKKSSI